MEKEKLLVKELSELIGVDVELGSDATCEIAVEERVVVMRYRSDADDWLYFGIVAEPEGGPSKALLAKALELNLFGAETQGLHMGLFGEALILSGCVAMDGLSAEALAERLLLLSRQMGKLAKKLEEVGADGDSERETVPLPFDSGFMQV